MFGKIIEIDDTNVIVENASGKLEVNYLNYHVIFEEESRKVVGEIIKMNDEKVTIFLVGEIKDDVFSPGIQKKPSFSSNIRIIQKSEVELLIGKQDSSDRSFLTVGQSNIYRGFNVSIPINDFFTNHFAILGNTGSGKSCGVARIIQNLFGNSEKAPHNAHMVFFDVYGEYNKAFRGLSNGEFGYDSYTTKVKTDELNENIIKLPAYLLDVDDLALLLNATTANQLPILEKTLRLVHIFKSDKEESVIYKNNIIAEALLDILSSGKSPNQIRDQIVAILTRYNTNEINLDTPIVEPGYTRTLKQCLNIDNQGKMNAVKNVVDVLNEYIKVDIEDYKITESIMYDLEDIYYALEFALISEGFLNNEKVYENDNELKIRLHQIINSDYNRFFNIDDAYITKDEYVRRLFDKQTEKKQIINMNLNYVDDRFAKTLTKIYARMFFNFTTNLKNRGSYPIHIILEEAHRYVQEDNDINILGYNIFERITKEGRKYGVLLGLITQRPSELSKTALSQCSNFIAFKIFHPEDIRIISNISSNVSIETINKIKNIMPGSAMVFGSAFKLPLIAKFELPNPMPESTSVDIENTWFN